MSAFTVAANAPVSAIPSRVIVLNPSNLNVMVYVPGGRLTIWYCPISSLTPVRVFSISVGLDTSTVTPGSTPPEVSFTTPATAARPCARAVGAAISEPIRADSTNRVNPCIAPSPPFLAISRSSHDTPAGGHEF
jgi:hypothetical protein